MEGKSLYGIGAGRRRRWRTTTPPRRGALEILQSDPAAAASAPREPLGRVMAVDGTQATVRLNLMRRAHVPDNGCATVGKFMAILTGTSMVVGVVTKISAT